MERGREEHGWSWADVWDQKQSIPQTRLRFQKEMIGLEAWSKSVEWDDEVEGGKRKEDKEKEKMRGAGWRNGDLSGGKRKASERG